MTSERMQAIYNRMPVWGQNLACSWQGYRRFRSRYGADFRTLLSELKDSQWWEQDRLEAKQNDAVRNLIKHVYESVPYYRRIMDKGGLTPNDFISAKDIEKLPVLTKDIIRREGKNMFSFAVDLKRDTVFSHTSGTTGAGLQFYVSKRAHQMQWAVWWRHRSRFDVEIGQTHANFSGQMVVPFDSGRPPFWRENRPFNQTYVSLYHMTEENLPDYVNLFESRKFEYFSGYPSGIYLLADYLRKINHKLSNPPRTIITGAESLLPFQRKAFSEWLGAPSTDQYGQAEGVANASRCEQDVYHVDTEFCAIERQKVMDVADGEVCKIIGTSLWNYAQPFIRYDTGDLATFSNCECACGRKAPVINYVDGRIESYIQTPDGRKVGRMDHCFKDMVSIREAQIIQHDITHLEVKVVSGDGFGSAEQDQLIREIVSRVGSGMSIDLNLVASIPRSKTGKFRAVISRLNSQTDSYMRS